MNPAEMSDYELSESVAVEVMEWPIIRNPDGDGRVFAQPPGQDIGAYRTTPSPFLLSGRPMQWIDEYSPATDDAQALAAFDRAAELVGAKDKKISWTHYTDALDPISYAVIHWGYGPYAEALAATRPRALSECAVAAVRSWREMRGVT